MELLVNSFWNSDRKSKYGLLSLISTLFCLFDIKILLHSSFIDFNEIPSLNSSPSNEIITYYKKISKAKLDDIIAEHFICEDIQIVVILIIELLHIVEIFQNTYSFM